MVFPVRQSGKIPVGDWRNVVETARRLAADVLDLLTQEE